MDTISGADLARELETTIPRITRAVDRLGIEARRRGRRLALTRQQAAKIRRELGVRVAAPGLSHPETAVLAALRSAPLGMASVRAVASRAGLSPTATSRALTSLLGEGLVKQREQVIAAGRAKRVALWRANPVHPRWHEIDEFLDRAEPPARPPVEAPRRVPSRLRHLFWNTSPSQLELDRGGPYIARRLLRTLDLQGLAWGAEALRASDWRQAARARGLDPSVRRLALNLAEEAPRS